MTTQIGASATAARAHAELLTYWSGLRRGQRLPGRGDIRPEDLKRLLPAVSLVDVVGEAKDFRLRLAGTGLYEVYGREITGLTLVELYGATAADYWGGELRTVVRQRKPGVGVHSLSWRGTSHISILWLRLPLASNGTDVDMILGYDAIVGSPPESANVSGIRAA